MQLRGASRAGGNGDDETRSATRTLRASTRTFRAAALRVPATRAERRTLLQLLRVVACAAYAEQARFTLLLALLLALRLALPTHTLLQLLRVMARMHRLRRVGEIYFATRFTASFTTSSTDALCCSCCESMHATRAQSRRDLLYY